MWSKKLKKKKKGGVVDSGEDIVDAAVREAKVFSPLLLPLRPLHAPSPLKFIFMMNQNQTKNKKRRRLELMPHLCVSWAFDISWNFVSIVVTFIFSTSCGKKKIHTKKKRRDFFFFSLCVVLCCVCVKYWQKQRFKNFYFVITKLCYVVLE